MNNRRKLVMALGAGALTAPLSSFAQQQGKRWRVGFLAYRRVEFIDSDYYYGPFTRGMRELGYIEGKNLIIEWRSAEGEPDRLSTLAGELVQSKVDVLVTPGTAASRAAQKATASIPIVFIGVGDPIGTGLIKSLARPGGNVTGLSNLIGELGPKHLELLLGMMPKLSRVAILVNPFNPSIILEVKTIQAAAQKAGVKLLPVEAASRQGITAAFSTMVRLNAEAVIVLRDSIYQQQIKQIIELVEKHRLPSIGGHDEYVESGGLMSYGNDLSENYHRAAAYVDKIFKGARPADLPVAQPTKFQLAVNLKTAKALGIKVPNSILVQATKVIE